MIAVQLDRLQAQLLTSGLSQRNQPLYQVIHELIKAVRQGFNEIEGDIVAITTPSGGSGAGTSVVGFHPLDREREYDDSGPLVIVGPKGEPGIAGPMGPPNLDCCGCVDFDAAPSLLAAHQLQIGDSISLGVATRVLFVGTGGKLSTDSAFVYDSTNDFLGIGITPAGTLDVNGTFSVDQAFGFRQQVNHNTATAGTVYGGQFNATISHTAGTMNSAVGLTNAARFAATSNATNLSGEQCFIALTGASPSGTITTAQGLNLSQISNFATGAPAVTISQARGLIIGNIGAGNGVNGLTVSNSCAMSIAGSQTSNGGNSAVINISDTTSVPFAPTGNWCIFNASTRNNHIAGPVYIGHTATWGSGTNFISFADGTVPGTPAANTAAIYAEDVANTVNIFAINEASVIEQLTGLAIRKTADETVTNSTTPQADNHLTVNLLASSSYYFRFVIHHTTASANAGIKVQLNGTVGVSNLNADVYLFDHGGNVHFDIAQITALAAANGANSTGANGVVIEGSIETTTAGTFLLEWAQNTADAVNGTVVQEGSTLILRKLNA